MTQNERLPTTGDVQRSITAHCRDRAETLHQRIGEAVACLRDGHHLAALGAMAGVEEEIRDLSIALRLISQIEYRKS
jgi:hypothetical protein